MPGFNGTGPMGQGPMTGRGVGPCSRGQAFRRGGGRGFRQGAGCGLGMQRGFRRNAAVTAPIEAFDYNDTDSRVDELSSRLDRIESMLETLTKSRQ